MERGKLRCCARPGAWATTAKDLGCTDLASLVLGDLVLGLK